MPSPGLILITKASVTSATSLVIDNCFSSTYSMYLVRRNLSANALSQVNIRLRVGGVDAAGSDYRNQAIYAQGAGAAAVRSTLQTSFLNGLGTLQTTQIGYQHTWINNPNEAVPTTLWVDESQAPTGNILLQSFVQAHDLATSYTGMTLLVSGGVNTMTGTVAVFGLAKS